VVWFRCSMIAKWFAWWNSLGLLGYVEYIRGQGGLVGLFKLQNIKQQVIPDTIVSPSFNAFKCSCQSCRVDTISL